MIRPDIPHLQQHVLLAALLCWSAAAGASDLYKWVDSAGRTHYSDLPPADGSKSESLSAPRPPVAPAATSNDSTKAVKAAADAAAAKAAAKPKLVGIEESENSPERIKARADTCEHASAETKVMASDNRVFTLDAQGERQYLDDQARADRIKELQGIMAANCQ